MRSLVGITALIGLAAALAAVPPAQAGTLQGEVQVTEQVGGRKDALDDRGNAVIFLSGFREPPPAGRQATLAQENKAFSQRVLVVTQGEGVSFPNHDNIHHNVWSKSGTKSFDLGLYKNPDSKLVTFDKPGMVTVFCNIHPQMIATILVLPNTKYAVTGNDGAYRIEGIKPGQYEAFAWVEGAKPARHTVTIEDGKPTEFNFNLVLQRIPIRHLNKDGKPYEKY